MSGGTSSLVTSVPDFDGYQWRKYGQKQIEGAIYARSYYRCTRSAEQGCPAKRTVQRNDDDGGAAAPKYTVVYMGEHTCTPNDDSMEAPPVILETTAVVPAVIKSTNNRRTPQDHHHDGTITITSVAAPTSSSGGSYCSSSTSTNNTVTAGIDESPAISDDITYWSRLFGVHDSWAPATAAALQEMEEDYFTGPIRSPVHIAAADACWTIDDHHLLLLQLASNDQHPTVSHFSF